MKSRTFFGLMAATVLFGTATMASASDYKIGAIEIDHPWARASAGMAGAAGAFMEIENKGDSDDRLIAATTPVAGMVQIHQTRMENNIMTMTHVDGVTIAAGGEAQLKPGGYHVMLMQLAAPLKTGETFPLTLTFEKAGTIEVMVDVMKPGARGPEHGGTHGHMQHEMKKKTD